MKPRRYYSRRSRHVDYHPRDWQDETDFLRGWFIRIFILGLMGGTVLGMGIMLFIKS
jgi:hypothetical protein